MKERPRQPGTAIAPAAAPDGNARRARVGALARAVQVLDLLAEHRAPMTAAELARGSGAPLSTIYKQTDELIALGLLRRNADRALWLGPRLLRYGLVCAAEIDLMAIAGQEMHALARELGETVQICARDDDMMTVVAMARGDRHMNVASDVGTRVPLNWTASGRLLLGHLDDAGRQAFFAAHARPSNTALAETDPATLSRMSGREFSEGLAVQLGASEYAVACIAAPIRDHADACVATISIVLPESVARAELPRLARAVRQAAARIEAALGRGLPGG